MATEKEIREIKALIHEADKLICKAAQNDKDKATSELLFSLSSQHIGELQDQLSKIIINS